MEAVEPGRERMERLLAVPAPKAGRVTARRLRGVPERLCRRVGPHPALRPAPVDDRRRVRGRGRGRGEVEGRHVGRDGEPPERRPLGGEEGVAVVAERLPDSPVSGLAADSPRGLVDRGLRPGEAHVEPFPVVARSEDRERRPRPLRQPADRLPRRQFEHPRPVAGWAREQLERDLEEHPKGAERPRHEARDVVAGDVLHDLAAEREDVASPVQDPGPEHEVAYCAGPGPGGAAQRTGDHPADGRGVAVSRWVEWQPLMVPGERRLGLGHRGPRPHGEHELARLVVHDAAVFADPKRLPHRHAAEEALAAAAFDGERRSGLERRANPVPDGLRLVRHALRAPVG